MLERVYPGVYVVEIPREAKSIEGVATSTDDFSGPAFAARAALPAHTPEWTDLNAGDPGVTLLQLLAWTAESLAFRTVDHIGGRASSSGVVRGLAVEEGASDSGASVKVSPGTAVGPTGNSIGSDAAAVFRDPNP